MNRQPIESSQITSMGYDPATNTLEIEFKARGDGTAPVYQYSNFTPEDWTALQAAPSKGSHFIRLIKPAKEIWPFRRVS